MSHFIYIPLPLKNQLVEVWRQLCVDMNHFSRLRDRISHQILKAIEQYHNPSNGRRKSFQNHLLLFLSVVCTWRTEHGSWLCGFIFHIQLYVCYDDVIFGTWPAHILVLGQLPKMKGIISSLFLLLFCKIFIGFGSWPAPIFFPHNSHNLWNIQSSIINHQSTIRYSMYLVS